MNAYLVLLALSSAVSAVCAGFVLARSALRLDGWLSAFLLGGAAFWAVCELAAGLAQDPEAALLWLRISTPGWMLMGPVVLHLMVRVHHQPTRLERWLPAAYMACVACVVLACVTDTIIQTPVRTRWGWTFEPGPLHPAFYTFTILCVAAGFRLLQRSFRAGVWEGEKRQRPLILAGMFVPATLASVTDVFLPWSGIHVPRLGAISFSVLGVLAVVNVVKFGNSMVSAGSFSTEILANLAQGVALLNRSGRIRRANEQLARLAERPLAELEGLPIAEFVTSGLPQSLEEVEEQEAELQTPHGERIPVAVTSRVMRDRLGQAVGLVVSIRDLREILSLRSGLVTSARLAAVGQLAAGIAHEINNPLAFVRANLGQLHAHWKVLRGALSEAPRALGERLDEGEELIAESIEGVDRAAEIVRSVKGFSQADSTYRLDCDVNALLDEVAIMATPQLRGRLVVERCYSDVSSVRAAPQQLKQVFLNLVVNGAQASGDGGHLRIATQERDGWVEVDVRDDGDGIAPEIRGRIFDPFFTTKAAGEGTGLGLAIAHQVVHSHGGSIEVESEPGRGTCFRVRLPAGTAD